MSIAEFRHLNVFNLKAQYILSYAVACSRMRDSMYMRDTTHKFFVELAMRCGLISGQDKSLLLLDRNIPVGPCKLIIFNLKRACIIPEFGAREYLDHIPSPEVEGRLVRASAAFKAVLLELLEATRVSDDSDFENVPDSLFDRVRYLINEVNASCVAFDLVEAPHLYRLASQRLDCLYRDFDLARSTKLECRDAVKHFRASLPEEIVRRYDSARGGPRVLAVPVLPFPEVMEAVCPVMRPGTVFSLSHL
jgi:hypothetical protein